MAFNGRNYYNGDTSYGTFDRYHCVLLDRWLNGYDVASSKLLSELVIRFLVPMMLWYYVLDGTRIWLVQPDQGLGKEFPGQRLMGSKMINILSSVAW